MPAFNRFHCFTEDLLKGVHDFETDSFAVMLSNVAPDSATDALTADITEIAASGGYVAGGYALDNVTLINTAGTTKVVIDDEVVTATGAALPTHRYWIIRNATAAGGPLVAWYDYGSALSLNEDESVTLDFNQSNGVFALG